MSMLTPPGMGGRYGKYRLKGDKYGYTGRRRSRGRVVLASVAAIVALTVLGWGTLQLIDVFSGNDKASASGGGVRGTAACDKSGKSADKAGGKAAGDTGEKNAKPAGDSAEPAGKAATPAEKDGKPKESKGPKPKGIELPDPDEIPVNVYNATSESGLAKTTADELKKRGFRIGKVDNAPAAMKKKAKADGMLIGTPGKQTTDRMKVLGLQMKGADTGYDQRKGGDIDLVIGNGSTKLTPEKEADRALKNLTDPQPEPAHTPKPKPSPSHTC